MQSKSTKTEVLMLFMRFFINRMKTYILHSMF